MVDGIPIPGSCSISNLREEYRELFSIAYNVERNKYPLCVAEQNSLVLVNINSRYNTYRVS